MCPSFSARCALRTKATTVVVKQASFVIRDRGKKKPRTGTIRCWIILLAGKPAQQRNTHIAESVQNSLICLAAGGSCHPTDSEWKTVYAFQLSRAAPMSRPIAAPIPAPTGPPAVKPTADPRINPTPA